MENTVTIPIFTRTSKDGEYTQDVFCELDSSAFLLGGGKKPEDLEGRTRNSGVKGLVLQVEHPLFEGYAAGGGESAESSVGADYAMAGDDQRQGVSGKCASDGPAGGRAAHLLCQAGISYCLARSYTSTGDQDGCPERTEYIQSNRNLPAKLHGAAVKIGDYLFLKSPEEAFVQLGGGQTRQEAGLDAFQARSGQVGTADGRFRAGEAKISPLRPENHIFCHFLHFSARLPTQIYYLRGQIH